MPAELHCLQKPADLYRVISAAWQRLKTRLAPTRAETILSATSNGHADETLWPEASHAPAARQPYTVETWPCRQKREFKTGEDCKDSACNALMG